MTDRKICTSIVIEAFMPIFLVGEIYKHRKHEYRRLTFFYTRKGVSMSDGKRKNPSSGHLV